MRDSPLRRKLCLEDLGVLMDGERVVPAVAGDDQAQPVFAPGFVEASLGVARRVAGVIGLHPDLQEVNGRRLGGVVFAVAHAGAGGHHLHVAGADHRSRAEAVLVLQRALEDIGNDLHVAMAMRREAAAGRDAVLVDHAQRAETHVPRIDVTGEGEGVETVEPAMVGMAALGGRSDDNRHDGPRGKAAGALAPAGSVQISRPIRASPE